MDCCDHSGSTVAEQTEQEMQSYYDDRSEEWQAGSRGEELLAKIECIQSALSELPELR